MGTKPIIIDTWDYTEGYVGCIMGNKPHSVRERRGRDGIYEARRACWAPTPVRCPCA